MRSMWQRLSLSLFLVFVWQGIIAEMLLRWMKTAARNLAVLALAWSVVVAQQTPPPPPSGNAPPNQINPSNQIKWPASCIPPNGSGVYSPGGNACVPPGTAANAAGSQGQAQYNLDGHTFGAATSSYDPNADTWYNDMAANKGPKVDVTHKDFAVAAGCPAVTKNGTNDITCNVNAAITWAHAHLNGNSPANLYIPAGLYKLCGTIYLNQGDHLRGDSEDATTLQMCPGGQSAIVVGSASPPYGNFPYAQGITDLTLVGQGKQTTGTMIEAFQPHLYINHVSMSNHGGRGLVLMKNAERSHFENMPLSNIRAPLINAGANENYWGKVDILTPGVTANPETYCYNINCVNGVVPNPSTGNSVNWYPDHHNAVVLYGDNLVFEYSSLKSMPFLSAICISTQISKIAHLYTEGNWGGLPLINSSIQNGCYENEGSYFTLSAAMTATGAPTITDTSWTWQYVNENNLVTAAAFNPLTYDLACADFIAGSTNPCGALPSVQQGQFERITVGGWGPNGQGQTIKRCQTGSTVTCTANSSGPLWPAGAKVVSAVLTGQQGAPDIQDVHFNASSRGTTTAAAGGTVTAMCNDQVIGQQCAEVILGPVLDGIELTLPGATVGIGNNNWFSIRGGAHFRNIANSGFGGYANVSGVTKVFTGGISRCDGPSIRGAAGQSAANIPTAASSTNGCEAIVFVTYPNGTPAFGGYTNPYGGVVLSTNAISQLATSWRDVSPYSSNGYHPGGKQVWDGYCFYDQAATATTATSNRHCFFGGPDYAAPGTSALTQDYSSNNGISWNTQFKVTNDGAGHPTLFAGTRYFTLTAGGGSNPWAASTFGTAANQNLTMPAVTGMPSGGMGIVSKANYGAAGDALDVVTNDGVQLMGVSHNGNTQMGPMYQGLMSNFIHNSFNFLASSWTPTGSPTITGGQTDFWGGTTGTKIVTTGASTVADNVGTLNSANQYIACAHMRGNAGGETVQVSAFALGGPTFTLTTTYAWYCSLNGRSINGYNLLTLSVPAGVTIFADATLTVSNGANTVGSNSIVWSGALPLYMPTSGTAYPTALLAMSQGNNLIAPLPALAALPLVGVTGSIGGGPLAAGACASGTVSIAGVTVGEVGDVMATDGTMQAGYVVSAGGTTAGVATVSVCAIVAGTPVAKTYNVRLIP